MPAIRPRSGSATLAALFLTACTAFTGLPATADPVGAAKAPTRNEHPANGAERNQVAALDAPASRAAAAPGGRTAFARTRGTRARRSCGSTPRTRPTGRSSWGCTRTTRWRRS
ncbi:hypothetical protein ACFQV2_20065 [Actinokineospora soli]|uniref:Uncharacterized protein n=1 Tax=Actinokineospora soli TaxID=1048753 RepID=A0ABW2TPK9_9PSEU